MSMSTGDVRRPEVNKLSTKAVAADGDKPDKGDDKSPPAAKATAAKASGTKARPAGARPAGSAKGAAARGPAGKGKGRKPTGPVKVNQGINWGPVAMFGGAGLIAVLIIGFGAFTLIKEANKGTWQEQAAEIPGIQNYLVSNPEWFKFGAEGNHKAGDLSYKMSPSAGGVHNPQWQNCMGDVYAAEIPEEQATHAEEHGAVWVTYNPSLPQDQIDALKAKVDGRSYMLMSPYPGLDKPISLQTWGYQLKVDNASDERIDQFISALRQNATVEAGATCGSGITDTSPKPLDLQGAKG